MKDVKKLIIIATVVSTPFILIFSIIFACRHGNYKDALYSLENRRYALAQEQFLTLGNYLDSEMLAVEAERLATQDKLATKALHPVSGYSYDGRITSFYWCKESNVGISISWGLEYGDDFYATWAGGNPWNMNPDSEQNLFGEVERVQIGNAIGFVRWDPMTGEFIFLQHASDYASQNMYMPLLERYRGKVNNEGILELYNTEGEYYKFCLYAYDDYTSLKKTFVNKELSELVGAEWSGS